MAEPAAVRTSDGYILVRRPDGSYTDGDLTFDSLEQLHAQHPPGEEKWYDELLRVHPAPWKYKKNAAECGNGSRIDVIEDAKENCVLGTYGSSWTMVGALWAWYESVKDQVEKEAEEMTAAIQRVRALDGGEGEE